MYHVSNINKGFIPILWLRMLGQMYVLGGCACWSLGHYPCRTYLQS